MSVDTPLVEYLIIGTHAAVWLLLVILAVFGFPLTALASIDATSVLLLIPFVYLLGMLIDSLVQFPLEPFRKRIKKQIFGNKDYQDEFLALSSPELYSAYDVRVRRVRILGAAIFNWPLLCLAMLLHLGFAFTRQTQFVIVAGIVLTLFSAIAWRSLYKRAYRFRKNAYDVIDHTPLLTSGQRQGASNAKSNQTKRRT